MTALAGWQNFYVIVGSSAGALIGLQFVAMSLIAGDSMARAQPAAGSAFATPTIVHFGAVLALAGILTAPWKGMNSPATLWGLTGLSGAVYSVVVFIRVRRQNAYHPELEDWLFHVVLPMVAYVMLGISAFARQHFDAALFVVGAAAMLLLFIGIHNAWDAVTYHVFFKKR